MVSRSSVCIYSCKSSQYTTVKNFKYLHFSPIKYYFKLHVELPMLNLPTRQFIHNRYKTDSKSTLKIITPNTFPEGQGREGGGKIKVISGFRIHDIKRKKCRTAALISWCLFPQLNGFPLSEIFSVLPQFNLKLAVKAQRNNEVEWHGVFSTKKPH